MLSFLRILPLVALALPALTACHREADGMQPAILTGQWRLVATSGGFVGVRQPAPAGSDCRLVFGPDSAYTRYDNGKLIETSTFQLRRQSSYAGGPTEPVLVLKTTYLQGLGSPYYVYYITQLSAQELQFTNGSAGCALNYEYERISGDSSPVAGN